MNPQGALNPQDSFWSLDELPLCDDDAFVDLLTVPEIKRQLFAERRDDELGLRALLERPEAITRSRGQRRPVKRRGTSDLKHAA